MKKGSTPCKQRAEPIKSIDTLRVFNYSMIVATRPEPTVRPPSRFVGSMIVVFSHVFSVIYYLYYSIFLFII